MKHKLVSMKTRLCIKLLTHSDANQNNMVALMTKTLNSVC
jgi:hypothetical protein